MDNRRNRALYGWTSWLTAGLLAVALAGCGGGGGDGDSAAPAPTPGTGTTAPSATAVGAAVTTAAAVSTNDTSTNPTAAFTVLQAAGLPPVTVNSPPKVNFTVFSDGAVLKGLTASNVSFIIAKLVPGTNGTPDQWLSYTNRTETATATVGPNSKPVLASANQATTDPKQTDAALLAAQLAYNDAGYYTYTFSTDIKDATKTNGVVYDAAATHRVAIQLSYKNKAGATVLVNPYFDFTVDANGNAVPVTATNAAHKVVDITSCNQCHSKLALHGGGRVDTQYCVLCHNAATTDANSGNVLDLRIMVHKIHAGSELKARFGADYTIWGYKDSQNSYADVAFPQDLRNCTTCHDKTVAPQADNWKNVPSRAACGSCHAGIDFATGKGTTIAGATTGHVGGAKANDSQCILCHDATTIPVYHTPVTPADPGNALNTVGGNTHSYSESIDGNTSNLPAGAIVPTWKISSVSKNASNNPVMVFQLLQNGVAVPMNTYSAGGKTEIWDNFIGSPSLYFVWAEPQDGVTKPSDFNKAASVWLKALWNGKSTGAGAGTLTYNSTTGYYTATLTGTTIPATSGMLTGGVGYTYGSGSQPLTQTNVSGYATTVSPVDPTKMVGGLAVPAPNVSLAASPTDARRQVVDTALCNKCHKAMGVFTASAFHAGQRNDAATCAFCHNPGKTSSGGWSLDAGVFIHGIHAASKRSVPFNYQASATNTLGYGEVGYPGILQKCETCHLPGTYDFSAPASQAQVANRLYRTTAAADVTTAAATAGYGYAPADLYPRDTTTNATNNLVSSPIAAACFSCHDGKMVSNPAQTVRDHMESLGGGSIYRTRSVAIAKTEACLLCHQVGGYAPIAAVHAK